MATVKPEVSVQVLIGKPGSTPAKLPKALNLALRKVGVTAAYEAPSAFDLQFQAERYDGVSSEKEYPLLDTDLLDPFCRVQIVATVVDKEKVLMDGYITKQQVSVSPEFQASITATGEDMSVKMDLFDVFAEFPVGKKPSQIVSTVLGNYKSLNVKTDVVAPKGGEVESKKPTQQQETDRKFVMKLAHDNDCIFFVEPGASKGDNTAYWGPRKEESGKQTSLAINLGSADNLESVSLGFDGLAASITFGKYLDRTQGEMVQKLEAGSVKNDPTSTYAKQTPIPSKFSSLATTPEQFVSQLSDLSVRGSLYPLEKTVGTNLAKAKDLAQAATDRSAESVVSVSGELDTAKYGGFLEVRGKVELRGVGKRYDGEYLVKEVKHNINLDPTKSSYTQSFTLVRGGLEGK